MKYQAIAKNGTVLETIENVEVVEHAQGFFFFEGELNTNIRRRDILYAISDESLRAVKKVD